ncbi:transferrin-binding protein-like solute binding protein [Roseobacter sp. HKCCA0434]|uniref:transferrin-binding protein-like solute binding protein n=1 Tax=Roseobacter sp. HKCCA0434 TaxID=3079297 RepID=UPI002905E940|nr:transferrin-binding protein-like solute binding protein [Roseobacter sp. HKCCA0434]
MRTTALLCLSSLALAACGGGGSTSISGFTPVSPVVATGPGDTLVARAGTPLPATQYRTTLRSGTFSASPVSANDTASVEVLTATRYRIRSDQGYEADLVLRDTTGGVSNFTTTSGDAAVAGLVVGTYGAAGVYSFPFNVADADGGAVTFGIRSPVTAVPSSGTASYGGTFSGQRNRPGGGDPVALRGNASLTANFAGAAAINGQITGVVADTGLGTTEAFNDILLSASITGSGGNGTAQTGAAPAGSSVAFAPGASGALNVQFYGPSLNELGGAFTINNGGNTVTGGFLTVD